MLMGFIPAFLGLIAGFLMYGANFWCETIAFPSVAGDINEDGDFGDVRMSIWYQQKTVIEQREFNDSIRVVDRCVALPGGVDYDAKWKTAKAFSIIGGVFGGLILFSAFLSPLFSIGPAWKSQSCVFIFVAICQGLTLLFLDSNACNDNFVTGLFPEAYPAQCSWYWGARASISSVVFWFVGGLSFFALAPPTPNPRPEPESQTVTYTENPDGSLTKGVVKGTYVPGANAVDADEKGEKGDEEDPPEQPADVTSSARMLGKLSM